MYNNLHHIIFIYIIYGAFLVKYANSDSHGDPVVELSHGGSLQGLSENGVSKFLGVPYALPPEGDLRFKKPQSYPAWEGVRLAQAPGSNCPQKHDGWRKYYHSFYYDLMSKGNQSENCLNLDIYVPGEVDDAKASPKAVMVWIYGGGWAVGSKYFQGLYSGDNLAKNGDVIVVTFNYRVGPFGFISLSHPSFDLNVGLWDQKEALEWVQTNIEAFGGDPNQVTIFGVSSGGASVQAHMLSPQSTGLFHRAIIQSGIPLYALPTAGQYYFINTMPIATDLGCSMASIDDIANCLLDAPAEDITEVSKNAMFFFVFDGEFFTAQPVESMKSGQINKVPLLIGSTNEEGDVVLGSRNVEFGLPEQAIRPFIEATVPILGYLPRDKLDTIIDYIYFEYFPTTSDSLANLRGALDFNRDSFYSGPSIQFAEDVSVIASVQDVYMYKYSQPTGYAMFDMPVELGAGHAQDTVLIFGNLDTLIALDPPEDPVPGVTDEDLQGLSDIMLDSWTSFAKGEDLTFETSSEEVLDWPRYTSENREYVEFTADMSEDSIKSGLDEEADLFWNTLMTSLDQTELFELDDCYEAPADTNTSPNYPMVTTKSGIVQGLKRTDAESGIDFESYLGIPYARPPVGDLRWQKTQPVNPWTHVLNATQYGSACAPNEAQDFSEDCLFLNIWVPNGVSSITEDGNLLPVHFHVHWGRLLEGSGSFDMEGLAIHGDMIVVTTNYRVGTLGFANDASLGIRGNFGLWDARMALLWVYNNIEAFGGDSEAITISGQGAGGAIVSTMMVSPQCRGLFKNVMAFSGSVFAFWAVRDPNSADDGTYLASKLSCDTSTTAAMGSCLWDSPAEDVIDLSYSSDSPQMSIIIDGDFLPTYPDELLEHPDVRDINFLGGSVVTEGYVIALGAQGYVNSQEGLTLEQYVLDFVDKQYPDSPAVSDSVDMHYYPPEVTQVPQSEFDHTVTLYHDMYFGAPVDRFARIHAGHGGTVYTYEFTKNPEASMYDTNVHRSEFSFLIGTPLVYGPSSEAEDAEVDVFREMITTFTQEEVNYTSDVIDYIHNFVHTGDINTPREVKAYWPKYDLEDKYYLEFASPLSNDSIKQDMNGREYHLWNELIPQVVTKSCLVIYEDIYDDDDDNPDNGDGGGNGQANSGEDDCEDGWSDLFDMSTDDLEILTVIMIIVAGLLLLMFLVMVIIYLRTRSELGSARKADDEDMKDMGHSNKGMTPEANMQL